MIRHNCLMDRRRFLAVAANISLFGLIEPLGFGAATNDNQSVLRFGLITDVHQNTMHDGMQRLAAFINVMNKAKVDFICQLGDFCWPHEPNRKFLDQWNEFKGARYHVLGNHDMDHGFTRDQTEAFYGMPGKYYSFDQKGVHFVVLDGNEPGGKSSGYKRFISSAQLDWMAQDLSKTTLPTVVLSHQGLDDPSAGIENSEAVRKVLEQSRTAAGHSKVAACLCGHHHDDLAKQINGIHYIHFNSASYYWLGEKYKHEVYGKEIHEKFTWISSTAPYSKPLWAIVEIDLKKHYLTVIGKKAQWVGPNPWERGMTKQDANPAFVAPRISSRKIRFSADE